MSSFESNVKEVFANRLKYLREEKGMSQVKLAEALGVSHGSISYYENADRMAGIDFVYKVAGFFDCDANYLLGLSDFRNSNAAQAESNTMKHIDDAFNNLQASEKECITYTIKFFVEIFQIMETEEEKKVTLELLKDFSSIIYDVVNEWYQIVEKDIRVETIDLFNGYSNLSFMQKDLDRRLWDFWEIFIDYYMEYLEPLRPNKTRETGDGN